MMKFSHYLFALIIAFSGLQGKSQTSWNYISPMPGSKFINPENSIALRYGPVIKNDEFKHYKIQLTGSASGKIDCVIQLSNDKKTLILRPKKSFQPGETISITVRNTLKSEFENLPGDTAFSFQISGQPNHSSSIPKDYSSKSNHNYSTSHIQKSALGNRLPEDLPQFQITLSNHPSKGYYFLNSSNTDDYSPYLQIVDNAGLPIFYRRFDHTIRDFKLISENRLMYYEGHYSGPATNYYLILNAAGQPMDTLRMENGYIVDNHDALLLENGNRIMLSYDPQLIGMDTVVPGGNPLATVVGLVIQEIDPSNNVVLQWRSWDHFEITDAEGIDFTEHYIDYVHGNSVEVDDDGHLLISSRHLNEITKINRNTGDVIWRFGLKAKNNMFTLINDTIGFSYQHDARRTKNGTLTIYDNGNLHEPQFSQAIEYVLDETNLIAERIWHYDHDPVIYANATGSTRRLDDGNTLIGWGSVTPGSPIITEVTAEGEIAFEAHYPDWVHSYRVTKEMWETTAFDFDSDSINFEPVQPGDTACQFVTVTNNLDHEIEINKMIGRTGFFTVSGDFPAVIPAGEVREIGVDFANESTGIYNDVLTFCYDIENDLKVQRIAKQIPVKAEVSEDAAIAEIKTISFRVYPNPAIDELTFQSFETGEFHARLYTLHGTLVKQITSVEKEFRMSLSDLSAGIYVLRITSPDGRTRAKKIIKR